MDENARQSGRDTDAGLLVGTNDGSGGYAKGPGSASALPGRS